MLVVQVAIPVPVAKTFSYYVPEQFASCVRVGMRCACPFRNRTVVGLVLSVEQADADRLRRWRPITAVLDDAPCISQELIEFLQLLADYYLAPIGEVVRLAIPALERKRAERVKRAHADAATLFDRGEGENVEVGRKVQVASATALPADKAQSGLLRGVSAAVLAHLRANGPTPVVQLVKVFPSARTAVRKLCAEGLAKLDLAVLMGPVNVTKTQFDDVAVQHTPHQREAIEELQFAIRKELSQTYLLQGVTGSGKTEVYMQAIAACLDKQRGVIVLVPEIALTPQLVGRFCARFGDAVAVLHSGLSDHARYRMWQSLQRDELRIALGARSAIFAPVHKLGLIVVDEEHDASFKQEQGVRYHGRDMALLRAHRAGAVAVLGSATPSLEAEYLVRSGKAKRLLLPLRATSAPLPIVELIDLRHTGAVAVIEEQTEPLKEAGGNDDPAGVNESAGEPSVELMQRRTSVMISLPMQRAIAQVLERKEQAILFLNRRGFAPSLQCDVCGSIVECPTCSVAMTLHRSGGSRMRCHYCDYATRVPGECPACAGASFVQLGLGTESLEQMLQQLFPTARVERLDRDIAPGMASEAVIERMRSGKIDILVGTQMVTKGHDLPNVTLVGVVNADAALSMPDFRSGERAFQRLVQVAGRAGRSTKAGRVIVQTRVPDHAVMRYAKEHDVTGYIEHELRVRNEASYPPFHRLVLIRMEGSNLERLTQRATYVARTAQAFGAKHAVEVIGPSPAPIERIKGRYRYRVLLRSTQRSSLRRVARAVMHACERASDGVAMTVDVDPVHMM